MDAVCGGLRCEVRRAVRADVAPIYELIESMVSDGTLLRRPVVELHREVDTFLVAESGEGEFLGCAALFQYGQHLAEVRSVAVKHCARGCGVGGLLIERLLDQAQQSGTACSCLFTRVPGFFERFGFHAVPAGSIREKVAKDCSRCARQAHCDETAMVRGELPGGIPLPLPTPWARGLVQLGH
jgi:amino-acid N-acetyltransferase